MGTGPGTDGELRVFAVPASLIPQLWHFVKPDLERCLAQTFEGWTISDVLSRLLAGQVFLHIAFSDDEYRGFCISYIEELPAGRNLHFWFLGGRGLLPHFETMEQEAKKVGAKTTTFATTREAFGRVPMGYRKTYTKYMKVLDHGDSSTTPSAR